MCIGKGSWKLIAKFISGLRELGRFLRALVWGPWVSGLGRGAHFSGQGRDPRQGRQGAGTPSYLQVGRLSTSYNSNMKARQTAMPSLVTEDSRGLSLVPGPGEFLSGHEPGGQGVEAQLQRYAARDPVGWGQ